MFINGIAIIPILSAQIICLPAVVKSKHLGRSSLMNKFLLLVKWQDTHESKYPTPFGACKLAALVMFAFPDLNGLGSDLLSSDFVVPIWVWYRLSLRRGYC